MGKRKLAVAMLGMTLVAAACGDSGSKAASTTTAKGTGSAASTGCKVGVSWNNYQEERWAKWDEPAIKAAIQAGGGTYVSNDAKSSAETQANNVDNLIHRAPRFLSSSPRTARLSSPPSQRP